MVDEIARYMPVEAGEENKAAASLRALIDEIRHCHLCADRFAATATGHAPRPVFRVSPTARILVAGQAPGMKVHQSGVPFLDPSGNRLREWMGIDADTFYDPRRIAIVPMAFCFPGYDARKADLPPPAVCATTWRKRLLEALPDLRLTLLVGGHAQKWHLAKEAGPVTDTVRRWRDFAPETLPLPHPSWRNTAWLKRNPWFGEELVPYLQKRVAEELAAVNGA